MDREVDAHIERAATPPGEFYTSAEIHARLRERVFARSWQWVGHAAAVAGPGDVRPVELLPGLLDEPLLLVRDEAGTLRCLSNVCTHRANLVRVEAGRCKHLRCGYHGRRFALDGRCEFMPEFEGVEGFPSPADDLPRAATAELGGQLFAALDPAHSFAELTADVERRLSHLPLAAFRLDPTRSRSFEVRANWMLYVDNYLEGFHVPYVHPSLAEVLDHVDYSVELQPLSSLQIGRAKDGGPRLEVAPGIEDGDVAAYYYWLFPNTMLNVYPWGLSLNVVQPLGIDRTRVLFRSFVGRPELSDRGAGADLDRVEREDEAVVERVQRGVRARLYRRGRYSARRETAVHHFHRLLQAALDAAE